MNQPILCFAEVEWCEVGESWTHDSDWLRNPTCPSAGEERWCHFALETGDWFCAGQTRWFFYQSGLSLFNGLDGTPEELEQMAVVEGKVLACAQGTLGGHLGRHTLWAQIFCLRVIPLPSIPHELPPFTPRFPVSGRFSVPNYRSRVYLWVDGAGAEVEELDIYVRAEAVTNEFTHLVLSRLNIEGCWAVLNCALPLAS